MRNIRYVGASPIAAGLQLLPLCWRSSWDALSGDGRRSLAPSHETRLPFPSPIFAGRHAMARPRLTVSLLCATALLSACGGGGGGGVASIPPPPAAVAAPTPAPTPTPVSTPTPAATTSVPSAGWGATPSHENVKFDYDADSGVYLYTHGPSTYRFGPGDDTTEFGDTESGNFRIFGDEDTPALIILINSSRNSRIVLSHLSYGLIHSPADAFLFGTQTPAGNMPRTGSATYHGIVDGGAPGRRLLGSTGTLTANFATGTVSTSISLQGRGPAYDETLGYGNPEGGLAEPDLFGTLTGSGIIGAGTSHFSGSLAGTIDFPAGGPTGTPGGPSATGSFLGGFYGPNAAEAGYVFTVTTGTISSDPNVVAGMAVTGAFVGKQ